MNYLALNKNQHADDSGRLATRETLWMSVVLAGLVAVRVLLR